MRFILGLIPTALVFAAFVASLPARADGLKPLIDLSPSDAIEVHFTDGTSAQCRFSHLSSDGARKLPKHKSDIVSNFSCHSHGGTTLLMHGPFEWQAERLSSAGTVSVPTVKSVTRNGRVYYKQSPWPGTQSEKRDLLAEGQGVSDMNVNVFGEGSRDPGARSRLAALDGYHWTEDFQKTYAKLRQASLEREKKIDAILSKTPDLRVQFQGGEKTRCRRGKSTAMPCELFMCDPVTVAGKQFVPMLEFPSEPGSFLPNATLFSDKGPGEGPGPLLAASSVVNADTGQLLFQNHIPQNGYASVSPAYPDLPKNIADDPLFQLTLTDPEYEQNRHFLENRCASSDVRDRVHREDVWIQSKKKALEQEDLVELLDETNHQLKSLLVPKELVPPDACQLSSSTYITQKASSEYKGWSEPNPHAAAEITPEEANQLFQEVAGMKDIPFRYVQDGCYARAEVMAVRLAKEGVVTEKIWAEGGNLQPSSSLSWSFHVAPVIWVHQKDGSYQREVLDPSLEDHPVSVKEWLNKFWSPEGQGKYIDVTWPLPATSSPYNRTVVYFTPSAVYSTDSTAIPDSTQQQKDLKDARRDLAQFSRYLKAEQTP